MNHILSRSSSKCLPEVEVPTVKSSVVVKLERFRALSEADCLAVQQITSTQRTVAAHRDLSRAGDRRVGVRFILQGYACQYIVLSDGRRQIMALLLPGDECSAYMSMSAHADYNISALTEATFSEAAPALVMPILREHPAVADALWRSNVVNEATLHERITNLGRRSARERLAHLFCELFVRSEAVGLATGMQCMVPLSQSDIADVLGLSLVHTNRSLQSLRAENLLRLESRLLTILDFERLQEAAQFNPRYLHANQDIDDTVGLPPVSMPAPPRGGHGGSRGGYSYSSSNAA